MMLNATAIKCEYRQTGVWLNPAQYEQCKVKQTAQMTKYLDELIKRENSKSIWDKIW